MSYSFPPYLTHDPLHHNDSDYRYRYSQGKELQRRDNNLETFLPEKCGQKDFGIQVDTSVQNLRLHYNQALLDSQWKVD